MTTALAGNTNFGATLAGTTLGGFNPLFGLLSPGIPNTATLGGLGFAMNLGLSTNLGFSGLGLSGFNDVPEPASFFLFGSGLMLTAGLLKRRLPKLPGKR